ncbi:calcineurin subunit b [Stylonychia lemnae]|uniref:Calcineurin subunit b n=1 Tax=Stylonychia lemnae TaxID=5949 RepID=A0A077ZPR2_STYLE|nr:calcineurin subunit b [Stylonychia lemnae]|eukprot:CDW71952.1 calcineurin subunit b [Stylonychia lemnae]
MTIPDVDKNPLGERICKVLTSKGQIQNGVAQMDKNMIDFKEFVRALSVFNKQEQNASASSEDEKIRFLFNVYDIDGDGLISQDELKVVLKQLVANSLTDTQLQQIVEKTILDLDQDGDGKLQFSEFKKIFQNQDL